MPRLKRRQKQRREDLLSNKRVINKLVTGFDFQLEDHDFGPHKFLEEGHEGFWIIEQAWPIYRAEILRLHVFGELPKSFECKPHTIKARPGTRPTMWWTFDAPEPRKVIAGNEDPDAGYFPTSSAGRDRTKPRRYFLGIPCPYNPGFAVAYEEQIDFLERLDLLLPGELELFEKLEAEAESAAA